MQTEKEEKNKKVKSVFLKVDNQRVPLILEDKKEVCANLEAKDI